VSSFTPLAAAEGAAQVVEVGEGGVEHARGVVDDRGGRGARVDGHAHGRGDGAHGEQPRERPHGVVFGREGDLRAAVRDVLVARGVVLVRHGAEEHVAKRQVAAHGAGEVLVHALARAAVAGGEELLRAAGVAALVGAAHGEPVEKEHLSAELAEGLADLAEAHVGALVAAGPEAAVAGLAAPRDAVGEVEDDEPSGAPGVAPRGERAREGQGRGGAEGALEQPPTGEAEARASVEGHRRTRKSGERTVAIIMAWRSPRWAS
jgi:hypothetical protein